MQSRRGELRWRTWTKPSGSQSEAQSEGSSDGAHGRNRADRNQRRNQRGAPMAHMDETERIARLEQVVIPQAHHEILGRCAESHLESFVPSGVQRAAHGAGV